MKDATRIVMGRSFNPKDHYFYRAKQEGLRARSAYKLEEVASKHHLLKPGLCVIDLGAAPGGFLQIIGRAVGPKGRVIGVDLQAIKPLGLPQVSTLVGDVRDSECRASLLAALGAARATLLTSDMAPGTTGNRNTDVARSHALVEMALEFATEMLAPGGNFVAKVFMGSGFDALRGDLKRYFKKLNVERPKATRSRSMECFLVGQGFRIP